MSDWDLKDINKIDYEYLTNISLSILLIKKKKYISNPITQFQNVC